jgi:hypothetical protein
MLLQGTYGTSLLRDGREVYHRGTHQPITTHVKKKKKKKKKTTTEATEDTFQVGQTIFCGSHRSLSSSPPPSIFDPTSRTTTPSIIISGTPAPRTDAFLPPLPPPRPRPSAPTIGHEEDWIAKDFFGENLDRDNSE